MFVGKRKRCGVVEHAASMTLVMLGVGSMVFAAMSDSFWMSFFGFLATAFGLWLTYKKAADAQADAAKAKTNSEKAVATGDKTAEAVEAVSEANKEQHVKMNSQLDEMKKVIYMAAKAEGVIQGRLQLKADQDAEAAAMAKGAREALATVSQSPSVLPAVSNPNNVAATAPVPVQVVPADDPLPVEVKVVLPKSMVPAPKDKKE